MVTVSREAIIFLNVITTLLSVIAVSLTGFRAATGSVPHAFFFLFLVAALGFMNYTVWEPLRKDSVMINKIREFFKGEAIDVPEHDPVGPVMSQMYGDILVHRQEMDRDDRGEYLEYVRQAMENIDSLAPDNASKRAALVLLAESLADD